jgi:hypothetical protein
VDPDGVKKWGRGLRLAVVEETSWRSDESVEEVMVTQGSA